MAVYNEVFGCAAASADWGMALQVCMWFLFCVGGIIYVCCGRS